MGISRVNCKRSDLIGRATFQSLGQLVVHNVTRPLFRVRLRGLGHETNHPYGDLKHKQAYSRPKHAARSLRRRMLTVAVKKPLEITIKETGVFNDSTPSYCF